MYGTTDPNDKALKETAMATNMWYDEIKDYDFANGKFTMETGHFTQLVWKGTQKAGFGISGNYVVARYAPPGNYEDDFEANVLPKQ